MAVPALLRIDEMLNLSRSMLAYELLAGIVAVRLRTQTPGDDVTALLEYFEPLIAPLERDRPLASDVELILEHFSAPAFIKLFR